MKKTYLLLSIALLVFILSAVGFINAVAPNHKTSFSYKVTSTAVITKALYNPDQSAQVEKYIDSCFQPIVVFGGKHKTNKEVQINISESKYHIKGSPGSLTMTAYKPENSAYSLERLKTIFEGLKRVIKPN